MNKCEYYKQQYLDQLDEMAGKIADNGDGTYSVFKEEK